MEYTKILQLLSDKADSAPGKEKCSLLLPATDIEQIRLAQAQTKDALSLSLIHISEPTRPY